MSSTAAAPLVGRDAELRVLDEILDGLWAGGSPALVVTGEPGIGKTRLLDELGTRARDREARVLVGRAAEYEADLPLAAWADALDDHLDEPLEELAESSERHRLHAAMRALLARLAADDPLVVVLDDLHWADPASVDVIGALLRRPPAAAVLLALSLRPRQAPERLDGAIARAERERRSTTVRLSPLEPDAAAVLLGDDVPARTRDLLFLESGGNPFYLEHLARGARSGTTDGRDGANLPGVPPAVSAALGEELRALSPETRLILDAAAVVGVEFEPDTVAAVADVPEPAALDALDTLAESDLVRPVGGRRFTMRHPLVRRAIYDGTGAGWRLAAHGRAAASLRERGSGPETFAHHLTHAARPGDAEAVDELSAAAAAVALRAPASAARWLSEAVSLLGPAAAGQREALLARLAGAHAAAGHVEDARDALDAALGLLDGDAHDIGERVRLTVEAARLEHLLGRHDAAHGRLRAALSAVQRDAGAELPLLVALAVDAFHRRDVEGMREWARHAAAAGQAAGRPAHAVAGLGVLALCDGLVGDVARAEAGCTEAAASFEAFDDAELAGCLEAAQFLGLAEMYVERFEDAATHGARGLQVARAAGQAHMVPVIAIPQGFSTAMLGRVAEARAVLDAAVEETRLVDSGFALAWVLMNATLVSLLAGDLATARAQGTETLELLAGSDDSIVVANAKTSLGQVDLEEGRYTAAIATITEGGGGEELPLVGGFWKVFLFELLTTAHLALDDLDRANDAAQLAVRSAAVLGLPLTASVATRALARVALRQGDADAAIVLAREAVAGAAATGAAVETAHARVVAGEALAAAGRREEAVGELRLALEAFDACGARRGAEGTGERLRRLGEVQRHSARGERHASGLSALTQREREIAELVWDRRTNREIAETLFLSQKTVETHLRNIFAKALVSSRVELAREVERARAAA